MNSSNKIKQIFFSLGFIFIGILVGAYLFTGVQPRHLLAIAQCTDTCMQPKELLGLIGSVVVQKMPGMLPAVVLETDKTIAIEHPFPDTAIHYVVIPKRDIKNAGEISSEDGAFLVDAYAVMSRLIKQKNLRSYRITTNGPELQDVNYLHFHLRSRNFQEKAKNPVPVE